MTEVEFNSIYHQVVEAGYEEEIIWQRELKPCDSSADFAAETMWVILCSGMKEQIARKIQKRIYDAWSRGNPTSSGFNHIGKVKAIDFVYSQQPTMFENYLKAEDKVSFLLTIPFIGKITCWHLAKNLGVDCAKPDRHLVRVADKYGTTPDQLCQSLSEKTGEKKSVIDIVLWRACNLKLL